LYGYDIVTAINSVTGIPFIKSWLAMHELAKKYINKEFKLE